MTRTDETLEAAEIRRLQALDAIALLSVRLGLSAPRVAKAITSRSSLWRDALISKRQLRYLTYVQIMQAVSALWPPKHPWPSHIPRLDADSSMIERPDVLFGEDDEGSATAQGAAA